jgi:hypothetical protein
MTNRATARWVARLAFVVSLSATAQTMPAKLGAEQIRSLVSAQTLVLRFPGVPPSDPQFHSHWDFRADGSLCARLIGSKAGTDCADLGVWKIQDDRLCWTLQRIGTSSGINAVCGAVRQNTDGLYELLDSTGKLGPTLFGIAK